MWFARLSPAVLLVAIVACKPAPNNEPANAADSAAAAVESTVPAPATTGDSKIDDALSAAPASISHNATIMDWPDSAGGQPKELRAGTNGWTCFPSTPAMIGESDRDPMCLDSQFLP